MEPSGGRETPTSVVRLMECCRWCEVRESCLRDALSEPRYTVVGAWGGTSMTERQRMRSAVLRERAAAETAPIDLGTNESTGRPYFGRANQGSEPFAAEVIDEVTDRLEASFHERYTAWIARHQSKRAPEHPFELTPWMPHTAPESDGETSSALGRPV